MDNPDEADKTIINVKGVRKSAWEAAKRGATQQGDSMGTWLSDAIDQRAIRDSDQVKPPAKNDGKKGNPAALTPDQLTARIIAAAALQQSAAAMKQACGRTTGKGALMRVLSSLEQHVIEAEGLPPRRVRTIAGPSFGHVDVPSTERGGKASGKEKPVERQPGTNELNGTGVQHTELRA